MRFKNAMPESMPGVPAQRSLITGMRSFPFRDWKRTEGFAAYPGWGPVHSIHPLVTEIMRAGWHRRHLRDRQPVPRGRRPLRGLQAPQRRQGPGGPRPPRRQPEGGRHRARHDRRARPRRGRGQAHDRHRHRAARRARRGRPVLPRPRRARPPGHGRGARGLRREERRRADPPGRRAVRADLPRDARGLDDRPRARALRGLRAQRGRHGRRPDAEDGRRGPARQHDRLVPEPQRDRAGRARDDGPRRSHLLPRGSLRALLPARPRGPPQGRRELLLRLHPRRRADPAVGDGPHHPRARWTART